MPNMPSTLSLETSRKLEKLIGKVETELTYERITDRDSGEWLSWEILRTPFSDEVCKHFKLKHEQHPAPSFSELIRLLPLIGEKKEWAVYRITFSKGREQTDIGDAGLYAGELANMFMSAPTPEDWMRQVDEYLIKIL